MQILKWMKTVWDLGILQQAFVCLCIPRWPDRLYLRGTISEARPAGTDWHGFCPLPLLLYTADSQAGPECTVCTQRPLAATHGSWDRTTTTLCRVRERIYSYGHRETQDKALQSLGAVLACDSNLFFVFLLLLSPSLLSENLIFLCFRLGFQCHLL